MKRLYLLFVLLCLSGLAMTQSRPHAYFEISPVQSCNAPFTVSFYDTTAAVEPVFRKWIFGDGTVDSSGSRFVQHTYLQKGVFPPQLVVRDGNGVSDTANSDQFGPVRIGASLQLPSNYFLCSAAWTNASIGIKNEAMPPSGDILGDYVWETPAGTGYGCPLYARAPGLYTLTYAVCDTVFHDTTRLTVAPSSRPMIDTPLTYSWSLDKIKVSFNAMNPFPQGTFKKIDWYWGDGTFTHNTSTDIVHEYTAPGAYNVLINVTPDRERAVVCDTSGSYLLMVRAPYVTHNSWNRKDTFMIHRDVPVILDAGNPGATYRWQSADPSFSDTGRVISIYQPGKYWVRIEKQHDLIVDTITVQLAPYTTAAFTYERATCNSFQYFFHGSAFPAIPGDSVVEYSWYFGNNDSIRYGRDVTTHYEYPGTYMVWLNVRTANGDTASTFRMVDVYADSTSLGARLLLHSGAGRDTLFAYPQPSSIEDSIYYTYQWFRNDTLLLKENTGILNTPRTGTYKVLVENSLGCSDLSAPFEYLAGSDSVMADFYWQLIDCNQQYIQFNAVVGTYGNDTLITQFWNFGDMQGWVGDNPAHYYNAAGVYNVTLTVYTGAGYQRTVSKQVRVSGDPMWSARIVRDTATGTILTAYTTPYNAKVMWSTGDSSRSIIPTHSGTYVLTVLDDCGRIKAGDSIYINIADTLFTNNSIAVTGRSAAALSFNNNIVKAYPNPSSGLVGIQFAQPLQQGVVVTVLNLQGRVLYTRTTTQQQQQLDLSALPKGYYLIVVSDGSTRKVQPLILQ